MNNTEHELCVLGSMVIDPSCIEQTISIIEARDFAGTGHLEIFNAIISLYKEGKFNIITENGELVLLKDELDRKGCLEKAGGVDYLVKIAEEVPSAANIEYYAELVKRDSDRRKVAEQAKNALKNALDETIEPSDVARDLIQNMEEVLSCSNTKNDITINGIEQRVNELCNGTYIPSIPTGFNVLDTHIEGFGMSGLSIIAARPGMGKTAIALQIMMDLAERGVKVGFFSAEMPKQQLYDRMLQFHSGVSIKTVKQQWRGNHGFIHPSQKESLIQAREHIRANIAPNIWVDDTGRISVDQIEMRLCKADNYCDILFIDHLQELNIPHTQNRAIDVGNVVDRIKHTGREKRHTVLLCQLNRNLVSRTTKDPNMSDLKECGKIEEAADNIIFIHREDYYHQGELGYEETKTAKIIIGKARNGEMGSDFVGWDGSLTRFNQ